MAESLFVRGGGITGGEVVIGGNKNSVLPMIAALLLTDEEKVKSLSCEYEKTQR